MSSSNDWMKQFNKGKAIPTSAWSDTPSEENVINNSHINTLYTTDFSKGKYFQVVTQDENGFEIQIAPRTMFKVLYIKDKDDITQFDIIKLTKKSDKSDFIEKQKVTLSSFTFSQLLSFLKLISSLDLKGITERKITLADDSFEDIDEETKKKVKTLLQKKDGAEIISELLNSGSINSQDIVNTGYRKEQLEIFQKLLEQEGYLEEYRNTQADKETARNTKDSSYKPKLSVSSKDEVVWQYFFQENEWIFGYGLDYRFNGILQREFASSISEADGSETAYTDFLLGDNKFTTFVELKKPDTPIFGNSKNRSNSWCLSNDLIDAVSQILEQKASGQIKLDCEQFDSNGNKIKQRSYDSKVILIIGNWVQLDSASNDKEISIKQKTLELFRRDSRNIEIITYDELYDRAKYIVFDKNNN